MGEEEWLIVVQLDFDFPQNPFFPQKDDRSLLQWVLTLSWKKKYNNAKS